jgi:CRISPR/Cas system-associated endonuclease Cas1
MGFFEDDRIRNKNRRYNLADDLYNSLKQSMTDSDIITFINQELTKEQDSNKCAVLKIVQDYATKAPENVN